MRRLVLIFLLIAYTELATGFQPGISRSKLVRADRSSTGTSLLAPASSSEQQNEDAVILIDNVAEYCGVQPPTNYRSIPVIKGFARWTWRQRVAVLRVLHWKDPWTPVDSCINLECLWWKALSTTDPSSPCFEPLGYTYDMLPRPSRRLMIKSLRPLHPRWIHALLEVRMAYLNQAIQAERSQSQNLTITDRGVRVISLGAGYDVRSIRLLAESSSKQPIECFEFDLPSTIESKRQLVQERLSKRQGKRRKRIEVKENADTPLTLQVPTMIGLDLNDILEFERQLQLIFASPHEETKEEAWHTIFVVEGVLMYLDEGKAAAVLQACADAARKSVGCAASLCFADRLFDRFDCDPVPIQHELAKTGWKLHEWAPSPNSNAKHIGIARLL
jgi:hypothetical protein